MIPLVVAFILAAVALILLLAMFYYRRAWLVEREARWEIYRARVLDNDQRSVDNERWAERVEQTRTLGQDAERARLVAVSQLRILERERMAGAPGEPAAEHIRNGLALLMNAPNAAHPVQRYNADIAALLVEPTNLPLVILTQSDYVALKSRLWSAVNELESRT